MKGQVAGAGKSSDAEQEREKRVGRGQELALCSGGEHLLVLWVSWRYPFTQGGDKARTGQEVNG